MAGLGHGWDGSDSFTPKDGSRAGSVYWLRIHPRQRLPGWRTAQDPRMASGSVLPRYPVTVAGAAPDSHRLPRDAARGRASHPSTFGVSLLQNPAACQGARSNPLASTIGSSTFTRQWRSATSARILVPAVCPGEPAIIGEPVTQHHPEQWHRSVCCGLQRVPDPDRWRPCSKKNPRRRPVDRGSSRRSSCGIRAPPSVMFKRAEGWQNTR